MAEKILYFGYGANRDPKMMEWITGNPNLKARPGVLKGYNLCVQRLDQVPDTVAETAPVPSTPRKILEDNWPSTFTSYIIREDPEGEVTGTIWELTPQERELVRDWELIDFGWYRDLRVKVITEDGQELEVQTEGLRDGQKFEKEVDGTNYETWLNPPLEFKKIATKSREEYTQRLQSQEGSTISGEVKELS